MEKEFKVRCCVDDKTKQAVMVVSSVRWPSWDEKTFVCGNVDRGRFLVTETYLKSSFRRPITKTEKLMVDGLALDFERKMVKKFGQVKISHTARFDDCGIYETGGGK